MHKLRKTYSSYILAQKDLGVTDKLVQAQLGHADISTTHQAYYYNIFDEDEQENVLSSIRIGYPMLTPLKMNKKKGSIPVNTRD